MLLFFLVFVPVFALGAIYAERKIAAFIQDRLGPMEVGKYGLLQTVADILKLLQKEDIIPQKADKWLFRLAPFIVFVSVFAGFAVIPLNASTQAAEISIALFYVLAIVSLDVIGILMAGWASNSKYALFGAMRSVAQIIAYEVPIGLSVLCVVTFCQSLDLQAISYQQGIFYQSYRGYEQETNFLFGLASLRVDVTQIGGFLTWNIVRMPLLTVVLIIYFIASLAECNRAPFDIPEAESELIGGFHTEYSGIRWAFMMLAEYSMMLLVAFLGVILFLGSWNTPLPNLPYLPLANYTSGELHTWTGFFWGMFWLLSKTFLWVFMQMWVRWTYPRLRADQLMYLCWKVLTPFAIILLFLCSLWRLWSI
ncbi:MAG: NADH-quinone oxidoreductase subunit H [Microscillaceae bacterium]|nr:NADH-quinone oxidoreductase subunit H [Microscillaceae bacterium]MDW8461455.1 complex I subunit 1 family protein [Cytophagales bacterium]